MIRLFLATIFAILSQSSGDIVPVTNGTTLSELGVATPIVLDSDSTSAEVSGFDIDELLTDPSNDEAMGLRLDLVIRATQDVSGVSNESAGETVLSASVNGRTAIQIRIANRDNTIVWGSNGWIDGSTGGELGPTTELTYANYLQFESAIGDEDTLSFSLQRGTEPGHRVEVEILPTSAFIVDAAPGSSTQITVIDSEINSNAGQPTRLRIDYLMESDRAESAVLSLENTVGLNTTTGQGLGVPIPIVDGTARGSVEVEVVDSAEFVEGVLVASTDFNSPAAPFAASLASNSGTIVWPFVIGPIALSLLLVVAYRWKSSRSQTSSDHVGIS